MDFLSRYKKYDYRVQLMRIWACIIVIGCHIRIEPVIAGVYNPNALFVHGFFDDGVAIFFAVMGFFIGIKDSDDEPVWKYIGKSIFRILSLVLILMVVISFLQRWIDGEVSFGYCFVNPQIDYKMIIKSFINLNWGMDSSFAHLWYITSYLQLVVAMPLIRLLTLDHPYAKKARRWILIVNIFAILVYDAKQLFPGPMYYANAYEVMGRAFTFVLLGYCIYSHRDFIYRNKSVFRLASVGLMIGINLVRYVFQNRVFSMNIENIYFYQWTTGISLIFVVSFCCFFLSFKPGSGEKKSEQVISLIGSSTFMIYIIHKAVIAFVNCRGIRDSLYSSAIDVSQNPMEILWYNVSFSLLIFVISLVISIIPTVWYDSVKSIRIRKR